MKILITGFDPFGGETINPAIESVKKLPDSIAGATIIKLQIPTIKNKSIETIQNAIEQHNPDIIISVGQAGGRPDITIERVAINVDDYALQDNDGNQPIDEFIVYNGPDAYLSNLPIKAMVENIKNNKLPASISNTAGTFVCNHVMYGVRHLIETKYPGKRNGFIHIPFLPEQVLDKKNMPSMPLDTIVNCLELAIEAVIYNQKDIKSIGGTTH